MDKLTINELKGYLGTGLKIKFKIIGRYSSTKEDVLQGRHVDNLSIYKFFKPLLYPLSSLTEYREDLGFVPIEGLLRKVDEFYPIECYEQDVKWVLKSGYEALINLPFGKVQTLYEWHIDVHGLIEKGLAINIKTLQQ